MKIHASTLCMNTMAPKTWIKNLLDQKIDAFHIDIVDPSFANYIAPDFAIIKELTKHPYWIHYMATWNEAFITKLMQLNPLGIYFHQKHIKNTEFFHNIKGSIALELDESPFIDCKNYLLMNVKLGYSGQSFCTNNITQSHELKKNGKIIASDGGINLENISELMHFDDIIIGSALNKNKVSDFREKL